MRGATTTKKTMVMASAVAATVLATSATATPFTFVNHCSYAINLYDNKRTDTIAVGGSTTRELGSGFSGMFRHGANDQATLAEIAVAGGRVWYDISVIPPGPGNCKSYAHCKQITNKSGFNVPMSMAPQNGDGKGVCRTITCEHAECEDAYLYPSDDSKTRSCPEATPMEVVFCPSGQAAAPIVAPTVAPSTTQQTPTPSSSTPSTSNPFGQDVGYESGVVSSTNKPSATPSPAASSGNGSASSFPGATIKSSFKYSGKLAGNLPGTYNMVTNTQGCVKTPVSVNSPVGPMSEEVSMVFRGPMEIYDIAVFDGSKGGDWQKVSSFSQGEEATNMVFLNNKNIDYVTGVKSPQGLSTRDGLSKAASAEQFSGILSEASNPSQIGAGPGIQTGAEVNIMTSTKCSANADGPACKGYYDDNGYHGWNGGKKLFATKVKMPTGAAPNQPAIWMLNAQVLRSNQYGCNCRGMGATGGCGELDIAEVIETNDKRDKVTTHYYFYDGSVPAGGDNFATRPTNEETTYLTIIDDSGDGTIMILEIGGSDFDFKTASISNAQIQTWINGSVKNLLKY